MKRVSERQRLRHIRTIRIRARRSRARIKRSVEKFDEQQMAQADALRRYEGNRQGNRPYIYLDDQRRHNIICPQDLAILRNREDTIGFIDEIARIIHRNRMRRGVITYFNFDQLSRVTFPALLMLAAELDCHIGPASGTRRTGNRMRADTERWDPSVRGIFSKFGLLKLLAYDEGDTVSEDVMPSLLVTPLRRSSEADGSVANDLITSVVKSSGSGIEAKDRTKMYIALAEAMDNVAAHAYPEDFIQPIGKLLKYWWGGAAYDANEKSATFVVYDRGIGIHQTIPKQPWYQKLPEIVRGDNSAAKVIELALTQGRSQTKQAHRGKGLPQMLDAVRSRPGSSLRIHSGNVLVKCDSDGNITSRSYTSSINGTLIEWKIRDERVETLNEQVDV